MNLQEAVQRSCEESTLVDALSWIAVWECERAIQQARKFFDTGISTASDGKGWDTCFKLCFKEVMANYKSKYHEEKE